ncbi:kinase-like protein [Astrocystis sublimbata]|nr:kinase-like protein [Astrocystis sublimbata]
MTARVGLRERLEILSKSFVISSKVSMIIGLKESLRRARCQNAKEVIFVPQTELETILTRETIFKMIISITNHEYSKLDPEVKSLVDQIDPLKTRDLRDSRKRILATLVTMKKPSLIVHFIDAGIHDRHLPLHRQHIHTDVPLVYQDDNGSLACCPLQCFGDDYNIQDEFHTYQWEFVAPVFTFTDGKIHHYQIPYRVPLPFIKQTPALVQGGNSQVNCVVIHKGHQDLPDSSSFAVKSLRSSEHDFKQEVQALKLVRNLGSPHMIELLATFEHEQSYNLIYVWADDDLMTFWRKNPLTDSVPDTSRWALQQCLGISKGLQLLHRGHCSLQGQPILRGRHGDIKPTNIFHFAPKAGRQASKFGTLKIADFGLARFHHDDSYHRIYSDRIPATRTYRAPEADLKGDISGKWDVWSLGCVYLEFITWILQGWREVEIFKVERETEDDFPSFLECNEDKFFNLDGSTVFKACRKLSVTKRINTLHNHPDCTELIHDLLNLISSQLIRIQNRSRCDHIVEELDSMEIRCTLTESYYTKPVKRLTKTRTYESDKRCN